MICPETKIFILFIIFSLVLLPVGAGFACQSMSMEMTMDMSMDMSSADKGTEKNSNFIDIHSAHKNSDTTSAPTFTFKSTFTSTSKDSCDSDCCNCTLNAAVIIPLSELDNNFILSDYFYSPRFFKKPNLKLQHPPPIISSL